MDGCVKLPLDAQQLADTVIQAKDYAMSHGIVVRPDEQPTCADLVIHAPFTLLPSPVPRSCFANAKRVQVDFNVLMHRVSHDYEFLKECLQSTIKVDDFTRHMWKIYETIRREGITQPMCLEMSRSDYMFHHEKTGSKDIYQIKQIEFNTMAASFGGLSTPLSLCHKYLLESLGQGEIADQLPKNDAVLGLAEGLITAWNEYGNHEAAVLFLVFDEERNCYDQRHLEYCIKDLNRNIKIIRRSLQYMASHGSLGPNKELLVDGLEIAIMYMRSGYAPENYKSEQDWEGRLMMERSKAICCPNVYYHLAGTKKVQQVLAQPGVVEKFISDPVAVARIRSTFAGLYTLDIGEEGDRSVEMVMKNPDKFVMKPSREGGGNNLYGREVRTKLEQLKDGDERTAYILMERIFPAQMRNYALMAGQPVQLQDMVSELGILGTLVGTEDVVIHNTQAGHILRSKTVGTDEGGVATGYSALDSPFLIS